MLVLITLILIILFYLFKPVTCFITFADTKYKNTLQRIKNEAVEMKAFDEIHAMDESYLESEFLSKNGKFIEENSRGYGYWIWKPQVIKQILSQIPDGSSIVYADAGCTLDKTKTSELTKYISEVDEKGIIAFQFEGKPEEIFTKHDCIEKVYPEVDRRSDQIIATAVIIRKNKFSANFINEWLSLCEDYHILDDSKSIHGKEPKDFYDHRHDQSIFSLLCKKHGIKTMYNSVDYHDGPIKGTRIRN